MRDEDRQMKCEMDKKEADALLEMELARLHPLPEGFRERLEERIDALDSPAVNTPLKAADSIDRAHTAKNRSKWKSWGPMHKWALGVACAAMLLIVSVPFVNSLSSKGAESAEFSGSVGFIADMGTKGEGMNMGADAGNLYETQTTTQPSRNNAPVDNALDTEMPEGFEMPEGAEGSLVGSNTSGDMGDVVDTALADTQNQKIIRNYSINIETEKYDDAVSKVEFEAKKFGGFVEYYDSWGSGKDYDWRRANISVKIPSERGEDYMHFLRGIGNVIAETKGSKNVTQTYRDLEIEIRNYEEAEKRYLELYDKAEIIPDMLMIENELSRIRINIDSRKAMLQSMDRQVDYSTFEIALVETVEKQEVVKVEQNIWTKAKNGFIAGVNKIISGTQNFFIFLVSSVPIIVLMILGILLLWLIIWAIVKKIKKRRVSRP